MVMHTMADTGARPHPTPVDASPVHDGPDQQTRGRRWLVVAIVVGYVFHVGWRLWLARDFITPAAHADEDGYLLAARALAGGADGYSTENGLFRRVGYPMLLAPIYWCTDDAFQVYRWAQGFNALVNSLVFPLAALFARRVMALRTPAAVGVGFVVAGLPAVVFYSGMVMTDAILPVLALAWLVAVFAALSAESHRHQLAYAAGSGVCAGLFYIVHIRGMMVAVVHLVLVVVLLILRRVGPGYAACALGTAVVVGLLDPILKYVLGDSIIMLGDSPGSQMTTALTVDWGIALTLLRTIGQLWYLAAGTLGLGAVGVVVVLSSFRRWSKQSLSTVDRGEFARLCVLGCVGCAMLLVALGSAASLPFGDYRISYFAYPRYLHFLYPPLVLIGLGTLMAARLRARLVLALTATIGAVALGAVVEWRTGQVRDRYGFIVFDAPETSALSWQWSHFTVIVPTMVAFGLFWLGVLALRWRSAAIVSLVALFGLCVVGMRATEQHIITPMVSAQYLADTPRLVRDLHINRDDVVAEAWQTQFPYVFNHMREATGHRLLLFDMNQAPPVTATVVIVPWRPAVAGPSWDGPRWNMHLMGIDRTHGWAVWHRNASWATSALSARPLIAVVPGVGVGRKPDAGDE